MEASGIATATKIGVNLAESGVAVVYFSSVEMNGNDL